jgi:hypothetical protein
VGLCACLDVFCMRSVGDVDVTHGERYNARTRGLVKSDQCLERFCLCLGS